MRCIDEALIQKYVDKEATVTEANMIESHISHCSRCAERIEEQRSLVHQVKEAIASLDDKKPDIPVLHLSGQSKEPRPNKFRIGLYILSAACILLFALVFTKKQKQAPVVETLFMFNNGWEYDANRSLSEQELIIGVIDDRGHITEYFEKQSKMNR